MSYVFEVSNYPDRTEYATAAEAIAVVEERGEGRVVKFSVERNLPRCLPEFVHRSCGLWSYADGRWNHHFIYDGTGAVMDHTKPE